MSEAYEIGIEAFPNAIDPQRCWIVRELHGYYSATEKKFHYQVETLHPTDQKHFLTIEEAIRQADAQVMLRARSGFHFLFTINRDNAPWYSRFEVVLPGGEIKPL